MCSDQPRKAKLPHVNAAAIYCRDLNWRNGNGRFWKEADEFGGVTRFPFNTSLANSKGVECQHGVNLRGREGWRDHNKSQEQNDLESVDNSRQGKSTSNHASLNDL
jgi:hypothetical protein